MHPNCHQAVLHGGATIELQVGAVMSMFTCSLCSSRKNHASHDTHLFSWAGQSLISVALGQDRACVGFDFSPHIGISCRTM